MIAVRTIESTDLFTRFIGGKDYVTPAGTIGRRLPSVLLVYRTDIHVPVEITRLDFARFDDVMREDDAYSDVGWCNNWVNVDGGPKLHLYQPCDEPGVDDAEPALTSDVELESPIAIATCNVGDVVLVPLPFRQCGMVQCHAVVLGEQTMPEQATVVHLP
jgi:hypothetical protein